MQIFGWILTSAVSEIAVTDLIQEEGIQAWNTAGRNILRLFQVLSVTGMFVLAPMAFAWLTYLHPEWAVGFGRRTDPLLLLVATVIILIAGFPVDGLVRLNENLLMGLFDEEGRQWLIDQQNAMNRQTAMLLASDHWVEDVFSLLLIACLPALAEELAFRGVLQRELIRGLGVIPGLLLTALLFALTHWQPVNLIGLFFFGLILGLMRYWSGSIWYSITAHFVNNAVVFFSIQSSDLPLEQALLERPEISATVYALSFAGLLVGMSLFWWMLQQRAQRPMGRYDE